MKDFNLHNHNKINSFKTPPDYFDNLEDEVLLKLTNNTNKPVKKLWKNTTIWFNSIAAVIALFIGGVYYFNQINFSKIDNNSLETYIISNTTADELSKHLSDKDIEELSKNILKQEDIREYVNIDLNYHANWDE